MPANKAAVAGYIIGWLYLPLITSDVPGLPPYGKFTAAIAMLQCILIFHLHNQCDGDGNRRILPFSLRSWFRLLVPPQMGWGHGMGSLVFPHSYCSMAFTISRESSSLHQTRTGNFLILQSLNWGDLWAGMQKIDFVKFMRSFVYQPITSQSANFCVCMNAMLTNPFSSRHWLTSFQ